MEPCSTVESGAPDRPASQPRNGSGGDAAASAGGSGCAEADGTFDTAAPTSASPSDQAEATCCPSRSRASVMLSEGPSRSRSAGSESRASRSENMHCVMTSDRPSHPRWTGRRTRRAAQPSNHVHGCNATYPGSQSERRCSPLPNGQMQGRAGETQGSGAIGNQHSNQERNVWSATSGAWRAVTSREQ